VEVSFKKNLGNTDRVLRVILGISLSYLALPINTIWTIILNIIGIVIAVEGFIGY